MAGEGIAWRKPSILSDTFAVAGGVLVLTFALSIKWMQGLGLESLAIFSFIAGAAASAGAIRASQLSTTIPSPRTPQQQRELVLLKRLNQTWILAFPAGAALLTIVWTPSNSLAYAVGMTLFLLAFSLSFGCRMLASLRSRRLYSDLTYTSPERSPSLPTN